MRVSLTNIIKFHMIFFFFVTAQYIREQHLQSHTFFHKLQASENKKCDNPHWKLLFLQDNLTLSVYLSKQQSLIVMWACNICLDIEWRVASFRQASTPYGLCWCVSRVLLVVSQPSGFRLPSCCSSFPKLPLLLADYNKDDSFTVWTALSRPENQTHGEHRRHT